MAHLHIRLKLIFFYFNDCIVNFYIIVFSHECDIPANVMEVQRQRVEDTICRQQLQASNQSDYKQHTKF
jgi:hypothetical protein